MQVLAHENLQSPNVRTSSKAAVAILMSSTLGHSIPKHYHPDVEYNSDHESQCLHFELDVGKPRKVHRDLPNVWKPVDPEAFAFDLDARVKGVMDKGAEFMFLDCACARILVESRHKTS
jgi:hypothetical protein